MILFLLFLFQNLSWSSNNEFSQLIDGLNDLDIDPKCKEMSEKELALYCAEEICGGYKDDVSIISATNFKKLLTAEEIKKIETLPQEIQNYYTTLQSNAKLIDQKIKNIKNKKASREDLESNYAQDLISLYPFKEKVDSLIKSKLEYLPDTIASCKAAIVIDLVNAKTPSEDLYQDALQKIDQAVISKFSHDSAQKLRKHLKTNVEISYARMPRDFTHISPYKKKNPMSGESPKEMVDFAQKINRYIDDYNCNSSLERGPQMILSDFVAHDPKSSKVILNVSPYTCTHGISAPTIIAHEIGHMITYFISNHKPSSSSKKKFLAQRECVKTQGYQQPNTNRDRRFSKDQITTEEDHADALAFEIKNHQSNLCAMLLSDGKVFNGLDVHTLPGSSHSPSILRVMRDFHSKGKKLPDTCRELAKRVFPKGSFNQCSL